MSGPRGSAPSFRGGGGVGGRGAMHRGRPPGPRGGGGGGGMRGGRPPRSRGRGPSSYADPPQGTDGDLEFPEGEQQQHHRRQRHQDIPPDEGPRFVVMVDDVPSNTSEADLSDAFGRIGRVTRIWTMPQKRQALVEFQEPASATRAVELAKSGALGSISVSESSLTRIMHRGEGFPQPNRVLLLVFYREEPRLITMESLHAACSRFGHVCRAVMFRKGPSRHLHALVEFANLEQAVAAKARLNGLDIFDGCCTIKVDFALPPELTIVRNTDDAWDFTRDPQQQQQQQQPPGGPSGRVTPVLLLSGLDSGVFNCKRLFNLLCLYGNVLRVCLLARPPNQPLPPGQPAAPLPPGAPIGAFVEVGDVESACRIGNLLDGARMFGCRLHVSPTPLGRLTRDSVPPGVALDRAPADGSAGFVDYFDNPNNRFTNPRKAASNRPLPPFRTLYYWNCPPGIQEHHLHRIFEEAHCRLPTSTLRFSNARATDKSSGGMVQWPDEVLATEALVLSNNRELVGLAQQERGGNFVLRLRFADKTIGQKDETVDQSAMT